MALSRPTVSNLRRSPDRQEQLIGDQPSAMRQFPEAHGFTLVEEYVGDGSSGTAAATRAAFQRLIADSRNVHHRGHALLYDVKREPA